MEHVFLTGATGFVGARLVKKWLERSAATLTVLARSKVDTSGKARVNALLSRLLTGADGNALLRRVTILEGDLGRSQFGISDSDYNALAKSVTHIIHCGALVRFDSAIEDARRVNTGGTEEILALARRCPKLKRLDYMSTAYVAGCRTGVITEDELEVGQQHNNAYEQSKFEAECLLSSAMTELPIVILRPTLIVCDSHSGELAPHGAFTRMFRSYAQEHLPFLPGLPDTPMDLVPVDYVVEAVFAISRIDSASGRRFHLCAGVGGQKTLADLVNLSDRYLNRKRPRILSPDEFERLRAQSLADPAASTEELFAELALYLPYLSSKKSFDDANTRELLSPFDLKVPSLDAYFGKMAEFVQNEGA
jgi:thioester reductase-like protein